MKKSALTVLLLFLVSLNAHAAPTQDELHKELDGTMTDILCTTGVIKEMQTAWTKYVAVRGSARNEEEAVKLKSEFGQELHDAWRRQNYDLKAHPRLVEFLDYALTLPMEAQAKFAKSWAYTAQARCPAIADDYRTTFAAAMSLMSVIPH